MSGSFQQEEEERIFKIPVAWRGKLDTYSLPIAPNEPEVSPKLRNLLVLPYLLQVLRHFNVLGFNVSALSCTLYMLFHYMHLHNSKSMKLAVNLGHDTNIWSGGRKDWYVNQEKSDPYDEKNITKSIGTRKTYDGRGG
jgi:hypothetical protein